MRILVNVVAATTLLALGALGLKMFGARPEIPQEETSPADNGTEVETVAVTRYEQPLNIDVDGEATTYRVVAIGAEVEGRVVHKSSTARGGTYVHKGDLLFEIDPTRYELEITRLEAQLQQVQQEQAAIEVDLQNTDRLIALAEEDVALQNRNLVRMQQLLKKSTANDSEVEAAMKQDLAARNALQMLINQRNTLQQQKKTKQAGIKLVEAQLDRAQLDLRRCSVKSTLEGRIVADEVEEGDYAKVGQILVHISDASKMEIQCQLRGEELAWVWQQHQVQGTGQSGADPLNLPEVPCEVVFQFEGVETIWEGHLARLEGTGIDRDTRTFPCRVLVDEPQQTRVEQTGGRPSVSLPALLSGMYVTVRIPVQSPVPILKLPIEAVRPGGQVWLRQDDELKIRTVSVAHTEDQAVFVRQLDSGLAEGDRVIVSPLPSVWEGMKVKEASAKADTVRPANQPASNDRSAAAQEPPAEAEDLPPKPPAKDDAADSEQTPEPTTDAVPAGDRSTSQRLGDDQRSLRGSSCQVYLRGVV